MTQNSADISIDRAISGVRVVAVVGFSANHDRPVWGVSHYMQNAGLRIIPVNPGLAGQVLMGEKVYASLADIPPEIAVDTVDVFRRSDHVAAIATEAVQHLPHLRTLWLQMGVISPEARALAAEKGLIFVEDRCLKVEHRLRAG
ncbi:CoA-binding protein [Falsigemmobacter faecalis]|uniref:CoA-binding protein n=1 Tax=Falsigemmobacter faecalis TaxID=2488730 RepID=A0A3P3DQU0_9RHOB|nr:CoA-binding protein [Falsigemmobacter faecalis]RRH76304.1 CoA-binding protein [Falsigemmobacter faecalis]